jgi:tryptophan synthase beta chain
MGIFSGFVDDESVDLIGVEGGGKGADTDENASTITNGTDGILHGSLSKVLQTDDGQIIEASCVSAGLDYPGVGPEHAYLDSIGRAQYVSINNQEALDGFRTLCEVEGIIPALESSHAVAYAIKYAKQPENKGKTIIVNLSGRGDKDMNIVAKELGVKVD